MEEGVGRELGAGQVVVQRKAQGTVGDQDMGWNGFGWWSRVGRESRGLMHGRLGSLDDAERRCSAAGGWRKTRGDCGQWSFGYSLWSSRLLVLA